MSANVQILSDYADLTSMPVPESVAVTPWFAIFWGVPAERAADSVPRSEASGCPVIQGTNLRLEYFRGYAQGLINQGRSNSTARNPYWVSSD
jgi:hypothetical protein